jgi:hypothetical protein
MPSTGNDILGRAEAGCYVQSAGIPYPAIDRTKIPLFIPVTAAGKLSRMSDMLAGGATLRSIGAERKTEAGILVFDYFSMPISL